MPTLTIGVLALQGAFTEHLHLLQRAADQILHHHHPTTISSANSNDVAPAPPDDLSFTFLPVRTPAHLAQCTALIIPGGESTSIALIAARTGLLPHLREFVKLERKPVWGTCAGLILLAERADRASAKGGGQELVGGLDVRVRRNYFGRQGESFEGGLRLGFLEGVEGGTSGEEGFRGVFIRAPVVERVLGFAELEERDADADADAGVDGDVVVAPDLGEGTRNVGVVEVLGRVPRRRKGVGENGVVAEEGQEEEGDIVVVRQGNVFGTAFHPELTGDPRIHVWWLREVVRAVVGDGS